jgi:cytosine/adenosine deaminase-related metal-dependent hydrolase
MSRIFSFFLFRSGAGRRTGRHNLERALRDHDGRAAPRHRERRSCHPGDRILAVGAKADIDARFQAKQRLDRPDAILAPGLINTHTHAA